MVDVGCFSTDVAYATPRLETLELGEHYAFEHDGYVLGVSLLTMATGSCSFECRYGHCSHVRDYCFYFPDSEFPPHVWKGETLAPELQMIALPVPTLRQNLSSAGF